MGPVSHMVYPSLRQGAHACLAQPHTAPHAHKRLPRAPWRPCPFSHFSPNVKAPLDLYSSVAEPLPVLEMGVRRGSLRSAESGEAPVSES